MTMRRPRVMATTPCLIVSDLNRSIGFYCDKLGFQEPAVWGEPACFAMLHRDEFDLMLSLAEAPEQIRLNSAYGVWDFTSRSRRTRRRRGIAVGGGALKTRADDDQLRDDGSRRGYQYQSKCDPVEIKIPISSRRRRFIAAALCKV
jgi:catechol 2,3-dioxygenase-like lactoylglutathione lyase family enzyme